jgi:hypothetical protein
MNHNERHEYRDDCPGCQIALMDESGKPLPADHEAMVIATRIWKEATLEERQACNRVWVHNSRDEKDMAAAFEIARRIKAAG